MDMGGPSLWEGSSRCGQQSRAAWREATEATQGWAPSTVPGGCGVLLPDPSAARLTQAPELPALCVPNLAFFLP